MKSLSTLLTGLQHQYKRQGQRQFQQVLDCWVEVVGPIVAAQTRPLNLYQGVLKVATSSSVWSQNLVFERQRIIAKLNQTVAVEITDIRFSPARWQETAPTSFPGEAYQQALWRSHPSRLTAPERTPQRHQPHLKQPTDATNPENGDRATPLSAFQEWATVMQSRSRQMPLCPQCKCPTPGGELQRWQVCAICAAQRWSSGNF